MASAGDHVHSLRQIGFVFAHFVFVAKSPATGEVSPKMVLGFAPPFLIVAIHPLDPAFGSLATRTVRSFVLKQRGTGEQKIIGVSSI